MSFLDLYSFSFVTEKSIGISVRGSATLFIWRY